MNAKKNDVLIAGGGLAGCVAAKAVLDAGRQVTVIFPNGGSSELSAGAIDIMGVVPGKTPRICEEYKAGIAALLEQYPEHVYGKCGKELEKGVETLISLAADGGYTFVGFEGKNVWVPNMMGTFSVNAYLPAMMSDCVCQPGRQEKVLVVGFAGNANFNAASCAVSYGQYQKKIGGAAVYYSAQLQLEGWGDRRKVSDGELADYLDTPEGLEELLSKLKTFCSNNRYSFDKILLPPVLGYINYEGNLAAIREACGCRAGEIMAIGNSVVGYRLTRALYRGLEKNGAVLKRGSAVKSLEGTEDGVAVTCVSGITDQLHPGREEVLEASAVILATGGFVGGGIKARKTEVWIEILDEKLGTVKPEQLDRNAVSTSGQDFIRMGVRVKEDMSLEDEKYKGRVFACGNVLGEHNFASERSGAGIAAASAYLAGTSAAAKA